MACEPLTRKRPSRMHRWLASSSTAWCWERLVVAGEGPFSTERPLGDASRPCNGVLVGAYACSVPPFQSP